MYPQHDGVFITSRFRGDLASPSSSWYTKIQQPSQVVPEETDAVATDDYCSGVLIEPDVLLTARHCVLGLRDGREVRQDMTHQEWCTRGNLRGMNGACVNSQHAISIDPSDYAFGDTTLPWRDWALIRLQAPLISTDQTEATIMVLSQWEDLFDPVFEPELLAAPVLAGPLNQCQTVGGENNPIVEETDPVWDEKCDNFRYAKGDQGGSHGRALYHREDGDVFVDAVYRESIAFDLMFGSADSGGPVFWDGRSPGGTRFVTAVVSSAYYDSWGITHMRGPRIAEWRSEIISQCAALPEAD